MSGPPLADANIRDPAFGTSSPLLPRVEAPFALTPPLIPDHELLRRIGSGSYGEVWLARNFLGAYRAVKIVFRNRFENDRPFERELEGIKKFEPISRSHESQVDILQVGRGEGYFYYVMELADDAEEEVERGLELRVESLHEGKAFSQLSTQTAFNPAARGDVLVSAATYRPRTLKSDLQKRSRLPFDECLRIALSLTTALGHLHKHGLVHRDVKPSNIIFVHGVPKLADIGLVTDLDATMSFVGTEGFLPPEGRGSVQADLYSLGKVFYEMATGKDRLDFPEPTTNLRDLPDRESLVELNEVVLKACAPDPRHRYETAEELHSDLVLLQAGKSLKRARWLEQRLAMATRAGIAAALVALVAIGFSYQSRRAERQALEQTYRMHIAQGVRSMDDGDLFSSVMWFAKALNLGHHDHVQEEINRWRIGTTLSFCPAPTQIVFHQDMVRRAVFSPDATRIATASDDRTAQVWDALTGEPVTSALRHEAEVRDVEFSPDGLWLVTASSDHTARVWDAATGTPISPPLKHGGIVFRAAFHPNGSFVATASDDHTARIWNARTGEPVGLPMQHKDRIQSVRFSSDGDWVATGSRDGTARIWRTPNLVRTRSIAAENSNGLDSSQRGMRFSFSPWERTEVRGDKAPDGEQADFPAASTNRAAVTLRHAREVQEIAFSPDGLRIATASSDRTARVWDARTGDPLTQPLKHLDEIWCIAFSQDGRLVATGSKDHTARIWDSTSGEALTLALQHGGNLRSVAFSPESRWLATASSDGTARVWNVADGRPATPPLRHASNAHSAAFDSTGRQLVTASRDKTVRVWTLQASERLELRMNHAGPVYRVVLSPDGRHLATQQTRSKDTVFLWSLEESRPELADLPPPGQHAWLHAEFSPDGRCMVICGTAVELVDPRMFRLIAEISDFRHLVRCVVFSPDGRFLVTGEADHSPAWAQGSIKGYMRFWDNTGANPLGPPIGFSEGVRWLAFSPEGRRLVVCWSPEASDHGFAQVWDQDRREPMGPPIPHRGRVMQAVFSPDGRRLVTGYSDTGLGPCDAQVWNPLTGVPIAPPIKHRDGVSAASFSPDGKWIVTASEDTTARVWDSFTSEPRTAPLQHSAAVQWAEFSPNGQFVLTASYDKTARVWDASTGQPVTPPLRHDGPVWHAVFSKDGLKIATASEDHTARIWKLTRDERSAAELLRLAELLSAHEIDPTGGLVPLETDKLREHWKSR